MASVWWIPLVYFRHCPTFKDWPDEVIHQLCKHSKVEEVSGSTGGGGGTCGTPGNHAPSAASCPQYGYNKVVESNTYTAEFIYIVTEVSCDVGEISGQAQSVYLPSLSTSCVCVCVAGEGGGIDGTGAKVSFQRGQPSATGGQ